MSQVYTCVPADLSMQHVASPSAKPWAARRQQQLSGRARGSLLLQPLLLHTNICLFPPILRRSEFTWIFVCAIFLALFVAYGERRAGHSMMHAPAPPAARRASSCRGCQQLGGLLEQG